MVRGAGAFGCRSLWASLVPMLTRGLNAKCRQRWCTGERAGLSSEAWWHYCLGPGLPERRVPMVSPEAMVGETHGALLPGGIAAWGVPADGCPGALPMVTFCSSLSPKSWMASVPGEVPADGRSGALPMLTLCSSLSPKMWMASVPGEVPADGCPGALPMLTFCFGLSPKACVAFLPGGPG